jgi:hypothetical protein
MHQSNMDNGWLEAALERHLHAVPAPESLWDRIETPGVEKAPVPSRRLAWALTAAMLVIAIFWGFHLRGATPALPFRPAETARVRISIPLTSPREVPVRTCVLCHANVDMQTALD